MVDDLDPNALGFYGECLVMCELAIRNIRTIKIIGDDLMTTKGTRIEVKTSRYCRFKKHWYFRHLKFKQIKQKNSHKIIEKDTDVYVLVCIDKLGKPNFIIIPASELTSNGIQINYSFKRTKYVKFKEMWELIR